MDLAISLIACLIVYYLFDTYGFKRALIFKLIVEVVSVFLTGALNEIQGLGTGVLVLYVVITLVVILITTAVEYWAYNKTNSFFTYFILASIIEAVIMFATSYIVVSVLMVL